MPLKAKKASGRTVTPRSQVSNERVQYREMLARTREIVCRGVPVDSDVLAISRGDTGLLDIEGRRVTHFPQNEHGVYAGFHPSDSTAAITHLESLRSRGAEYLLIPATAFWWLKHYRHFRRHLEKRYPVVVRDEATCVIFALNAHADADGPVAGDENERGYRALVTQVREVVDALLPHAATVIVLSSGDDALLKLGDRRGWHFPRNDDGVYAGHYPADSAAAIEHLESLRERGGEYLVIPRTAFWWLTHYVDFAEYVSTECRLVTRQPNVCAIFALTPTPTR